jgi:hypothetical protein
MVDGIYFGLNANSVSSKGSCSESSCDLFFREQNAFKLRANFEKLHLARFFGL